MKAFFSSKWFYIAAGSLLAVGVIAASLAFSPAVVRAQSGGPTPQVTPQAAAPANAARRSAALEWAYTREQARLQIQSIHLSLANQGAANLDDVIARAKENGKDVSALESALAAFHSQVAIAQAAHDQAAGVLSAHAGFDANGKVSDAAAAKQTVDSAHKSLTDAGVALEKATVDLRSAVRTWREANPPVKKTPQS